MDETPAQSARNGNTRRPRDPLGRPLPRGVPTQLQLEDFDALSPEENQALGRAHFNAGRFFAAHEAWETCWKASAGADARRCFKGLAQIAAGYVHLQRGNPRGAATLLRRGAAHLDGTTFAAALDCRQLVDMARAHAREVEQAMQHGQAPPVFRPRL